MTIKRRLMVSNIVMVVLPVLMSLFLTAGILLIDLRIKEKAIGADFTKNDQEKFFEIKEDVDLTVDRLGPNPPSEALLGIVETFNKAHERRGVSLTFLEAHKPMYPSTSESANPFFELVLQASEGEIFIIDDVATYKKVMGDRTLILTCKNLSDHHEIAAPPIAFIVVLLVLFLLGSILLSNWLLTRFVFKRITTPLDILKDGVHQIKDGQLSHQIVYDHEDEFQEICLDFNEMAMRLHDSVTSRLKEEQNRKELIAGLSHDLRSPLTSIKAYVEGLEKGVATTPEMQQKYLATILDKTANLEKLIEKLFLFSKLDLGEFPFHLETILLKDEILSLVSGIREEYHRQHLEIILGEHVGDGTIKVDRVQFRNALVNILDNSVKYKKKEKVIVRVDCWSQDGYVFVQLQDDGPGVSESALEKLFELFYREDTSRTGTTTGSGLGLAITKKIIERMGGKIVAKNGPEEGLVLRIQFPHAEEEVRYETDSDH